MNRCNIFTAFLFSKLWRFQCSKLRSSHSGMSPQHAQCRRYHSAN